MTRAPLSAAQRIAATSAFSGTEPSAATTLAISSCALNASPAIPTWLKGLAAISPATNVPWPCSSVYGEPPTKLFAATIRPANSGCEPSMPESITATRTGASVGAVGQNDHALSASRYHSFAASGSVSVNDRRRERDRREHQQRGRQREQKHASLHHDRRREPRRQAVPGRAANAVRAGRERARRTTSAPVASVVVDDTVVHAVPSWRCSSTAAPATAGCTLPEIVPAVAVAVTSGETAIFARPARTSPQASRYCVLSRGDDAAENAPVESRVTRPAGSQPVPRLFASSETPAAGCPAPRAGSRST